LPHYSWSDSPKNGSGEFGHAAERCHLLYLRKGGCEPC
jgi:hypothetical protein